MRLTLIMEGVQMEYIIIAGIIMLFLCVILFSIIVYNSRNREVPVTEYEYADFLLYLRECSKKNNE